MSAAAVLANARWVIELEEEERRLHEPEAEYWRAVWRAVVLSPNVETCEALLRGESVPLGRLGPEWCRRFGRR